MHPVRLLCDCKVALARLSMHHSNLALGVKLNPHTVKSITLCGLCFLYQPTLCFHEVFWISLQATRGPTSRSPLTPHLKVHLLSLLLQELSSKCTNILYLSVFICIYLFLSIVDNRNSWFVFWTCACWSVFVWKPLRYVSFIWGKNSIRRLEPVFVFLYFCLRQWMESCRLQWLQRRWRVRRRLSMVSMEQRGELLPCCPLPTSSCVVKLCLTCRKCWLHKWTSAARG